MKIKLGYEIGTGQEVYITPSHLIVTGMTQKAGKTTTLESLIKRSNRKAIVFRTKIGEKSFIDGLSIKPYFKDRSDWQFIQSLLESTIKEKLRSFDRAKIIQICKLSGGNSLTEFKKKLDSRLLEKVSGFEKDILTNLQAYLEIVLPKLQSIVFSEKLELIEGLNVMDLERFARDSEVQSLIIRSVIEEILNNFKDTIVVIPEAWKFIPQERGNPCKLIVEEFIRQGAANGNFIWIDSQDMTGVDKTPLKQISEWLLGYQSEINEVKHTLDQIPLPKDLKPKADEIMQLGTGIFFYATRDKTTKTYVQPYWLNDFESKMVSLNKLSINDISKPKNNKKEVILFEEKNDYNKNNLLDSKYNELLDSISVLKNNLIETELSLSKEINSIKQEIILIKNNHFSIDKNKIIKEIISSINLNSNNITYELKPLEKIKKDFLLQTKEQILKQIQALDYQEKTMIKWIEQNGKNTTKGSLYENAFGKSFTSGPSYQNLNKKIDFLAGEKLVRIDPKGRIFPNIQNRLFELLEQYGANEEELTLLYDHILYELLKGE